MSDYQVPSPSLAQAVETSRRRSFVLAPQRTHWVLTEYKVLLELSDLAEPELRLAGLRFHPELRLSNRDLYYDALAFHSLEGGDPRPLQGLPGAPRIRNLSWSPDGRWLAFAHNNELWLGHVFSAQARRLCGGLNQANGSANFRWLRDSSGLLVQTVAADQGPPPQPPKLPGGPLLQEHQGGKSPTRTFQDLLKNPHDEALFSYYLNSDLLCVDLRGAAQVLGRSRRIAGLSASPDGRYLLLSEILPPFSYQVTMARFASRTQILDRQGQCVQTVAQLPLLETVPPDFDAARPGRRFCTWREDQPATVAWLEAADEGDPQRPAPVRDVISQQPVGGQPGVLVELAGRVEALYWGNDGLALIQEGWWKTRQRRVWRVDPSKGSKSLLFEYSSEDDYQNPGRPLTQIDDQGRQRLVIAPDQKHIYLVGAGASPEGERPFLDRLHLDTRETVRLFHSCQPYYEYPTGLLDSQASAFTTQRESQSSPPNLVLWRGEEVRQLTDIGPAVPELTRVKKELIRYQRQDGVELTGTLYLPPDHAGLLPALLWAYPSEYKSSARAGQLRDSPYRYVHPSWSGPVFFAMLGYAVLDDPSFPVVGEGEAEPNDTYVPQLLASAQAAIDELVRRGVADPDRLAIGGHSYGAFTAANLLAHSRLFKAAIARSGAYNRSLTPFGFQSEERIYWQAKEAYQAMSPFHQADRIRDPILLIHGAEDSNSGTFPLQSERFYQALKGLGAPVRLCLLPLEDHGYRARESVLHALWEMESWLDRHLQGRRPAQGEGAGS
ncbi:prolyl oligopeptidase family serine peptidase [bacterium]|nr:prolyl oligopeptidase family serine peptidase [bacterium]